MWDCSGGLRMRHLLGTNPGDMLLYGSTSRSPASCRTVSKSSCWMGT